jgi:tricorn protease-like protein
MKLLAYICSSLIALGAVCPTPALGQSGPPGTDIYLAPLVLAHDSIGLGEPKNITSRPGYDNQPFFSFDETFILFTSADTSGATDVYRYDIEKRTITRITQTPESEYSPTVMKGKQSFSTVRVEADGTQRLWQFDLDGANPRLVLTTVDSVGYHAWVDDNTLGLFVLGEPHTLRIADRHLDADRIVASNIGRCLYAVSGTSEISFVQIVSEDESWITCFDTNSGEFRRLVMTLPQSQDFAWTPGGDMLMASGSVLYLWAGDGEWEEVHDFGPHGPDNITRLAVSATGQWLALVVDDS